MIDRVDKIRLILNRQMFWWPIIYASENEIPSIQSCLTADNGKIQKLYRYMSNNVFCQVFQNLGLWTTTLVEEWIAIYCCKICLWYRSSKIKKSQQFGHLNEVKKA